MLSASEVTFWYRPNRPVLREVGVVPRPGAVTVLVGPNGSGKSTLLRLLAGVLTPRGGSVVLDGRPVHRWSPAERSSRLAYVSQRSEVAFGFTAGEVVGFGLTRSRGTARGDRARVAAALSRVGLAERAGEPFGDLSVGQQQRVSLARAMTQVESASGPMVLLADEPVSAMDPRHAIEAMSLIRAVSRDRSAACVVVLHDLSMAARFADEAVLLDETGRVSASGRSGEVLEPGRLAPVFGVGFERLDGSAPALIATVPP